MFRLLVKSEMHYGSFPRIRGDVPIAAMLAWDKLFVFPAYAGMFRREPSLRGVPTGFPRIRGDVPNGKYYCSSYDEFSPHTRGCSAAVPVGGTGLGVFPAYAGMFRLSGLRLVPLSGFSPHTRGCSRDQGVRR